MPAFQAGVGGSIPPSRTDMFPKKARPGLFSLKHPVRDEQAELAWGIERRNDVEAIPNAETSESRPAFL